jgi:hypothetical protein
VVLTDPILKNPVEQLQIENCCQQLDRQLSKLLELDEKVKDFILDNEATTEDRRSLRQVQFWLNSPAHSHRSGATSVQNRKTMKLPKIEFKKFGGELTEWLGWWAQFENILKDEDLHDSDKFTYLVQCMKDRTRAFELVSSYPQSKENYPKVIKALKERFGNPKLLKQVYVRELIRMIIMISSSRLPHCLTSSSHIFVRWSHWGSQWSRWWSFFFRWWNPVFPMKFYWRGRGVRILGEMVHKRTHPKLNWIS